LIIAPAVVGKHFTRDRKIAFQLPFIGIADCFIVYKEAQEMNKKPITVVLRQDTQEALKEMAQSESRPVAQMARVIIERAINAHNSINNEKKGE